MNMYESADEIKLVQSGPDFFRRLTALADASEHTLHVQTYIFEPDETGRLVAGALCRAAARGVRVRLMVDEFGSKNLSRAMIRAFEEAGVEFRFFKQLASLWRWRFGRTLHHKVAVADGRQALVGGINIADKYHGIGTEPAWLDFAVYIRGEVCAHLSQLCESIFLHQYWKTGKRKKKSHAGKKKPHHEGL